MNDHTLEIRATNIGKVFAQYVSCYVYIPKYLIPGNYLVLAKSVNIDGIDHYVCRRQNFSSGEYSGPILPGLSHTWDQDLVANFRTLQFVASKFETISWQAYADNALPSAGKIRVLDLNAV